MFYRQGARRMILELDDVTMHYGRFEALSGLSVSVEPGVIGLVNQVTVTYYLRSLKVEIPELPVPREAARIIGGASVFGALIAITAITVVTLGASSMLAARREYVVKGRGLSGIVHAASTAGPWSISARSGSNLRRSG